MALYDIDGNILGGGTAADKIEPYFKSELATTIASVREVQNEPCLSFALCTDIHFGSTDTTTFLHTMKNISAMKEAVRLDGIICLGDMTDGNNTQEVTENLLSQFMPELQNLGLPVYFAAGNHDCNAYEHNGVNVFTTSQMYQHFYVRSDNNVISDMTSYGVNFYKDFDNYKIRMISLDSAKSDDGSAYHYYYPMNTVSWFVNTAMGTLPSGYSVLLISHVSPIANHNWKDTCPTNNAQVESTLRSFVNNGGDVICLIGHSHADFSFSTPWLDVAFSCNKVYQTQDKTIGPGDESWLLPMGAKIWARERGTVTEDTWDIVVIKPLSKRVNAIRFGAGEDRTYTYGSSS